MDLRAKLGLHLNKKSKETEEAIKEKEQFKLDPQVGENQEAPTTIEEWLYEPIHAEYHLTQLLPAQMIETKLGEYLLAEYRYSLNHWHGILPLGSLAAEELSSLCGVLKDQDLICPIGIEHLVFVDTETTGLAGGAGTFAFLVGVGYFEDEEFVLQQYLMEDYHQELSMLDALHQKLQGFSHLVTFNGKTFDWPLLKDRFTYHRMRSDYNPIHIDLLHPARRYYKGRLENCRLGSLENRILGFARTDDISGAEVPALFFSYLDEKDGRILMPVMQHNHWDILSLVTLLTHLVQAFLRPAQVLIEPEDLFSAGKVYEDLGQHDVAIDCYSICLERQITGSFSQEVLKRLSLVYKRLGRMDEACTIWRQFVEREGNLRLFPYVELAKYLEHQRKDYQQALKMTQSARELVLDKYQLFSQTKFKELLKELEHREQRLVRKLGKVSGDGLLFTEDSVQEY